MRTKREVEKRIEKKKAEIVALEKSLELARTYLQAMEDLYRLFPRDGENDVSAASLLRAGSELAKVRDAIEKAGKPLHLTVLMKEIGKPNTKANRSSLSGSLGAYVRKEEIFTRPSPNTFGLKDLDALIEERESQERAYHQTMEMAAAQAAADDFNADDIPF